MVYSDNYHEKSQRQQEASRDRDNTVNLAGSYMLPAYLASIMGQILLSTAIVNNNNNNTR